MVLKVYLTSWEGTDATVQPIIVYRKYMCHVEWLLVLYRLLSKAGDDFIMAKN